MLSYSLRKATKAFVSIELGLDIFPRFPQDPGSTSAIWGLWGEHPTGDKRGQLYYTMVLYCTVQYSVHAFCTVAQASELSIFHFLIRVGRTSSPTGLKADRYHETKLPR